MATAIVTITGTMIGPVQAGTGTQFTYFELRAEHSEKCLDVDGRGSGGATANLANVMQYECWGGTNQQWRIADVGNGYFELRARHSDKCLDVDGGATANLANVLQFQCVGDANQHWRTVPLGNGYFELRAKHSNKCLDVDGRGPGGATANLANVMQYQCWGGANQHWRFNAVQPAPPPKDGDSVWITSPNRLMCLAIDSRYDAAADMALVAVDRCYNVGLDGYWRYDQVQGTAAEFRSYYSDKCLDIAAASKDTNAAAVQYRCWGGASQGNPNQQWKLLGVRGGTEGLYQVQNQHSFMCLTRTGETRDSVVVQRGCAANQPANEWRVEPAVWIN
ncbi:RICIN domain-containing protein [Actinoplanes bogorensis]|uniref:RICIN domain-containing protein n=1 Tax=Paractinoplanes bogorensis TaxID=1610840 RepID=A0ABS5YV30_9ACTN|nr:RICIN domain-containing protein [Actinoplanes bogorensis]MBU2667304.1 RICIN domain-containing protein [Actinoplanes bogorensis]